jgi:formylglycine-generating enzyme required for sulfatase activity
MQRILLLFLIIFLFPNSLYGDEPHMLSIPAEESSTKEGAKFADLDNYYIDKTEVTQKDYIEVMGDTKFFFRGENHPAEQITWFKAKAYCEKIGIKIAHPIGMGKSSKR